MKKFFMMLCMALTVCSSIPAYSQALFSRKDAQKEVKKEAKQILKEKWLFSGTGTLENALLTFHLAQKDYGGKMDKIVVSINNVKSLRLGEKMLLNDAQSQYAQEISSLMMGAQESHTGDEDILLDDNVVKLSKEFAGDVKKQFVLYRKNPDGRYDMKGYFLVDGGATNAKLQRLMDEGKISDEIRRRVLGDGE